MEGREGGGSGWRGEGKEESVGMRVNTAGSTAGINPPPHNTNKRECSLLGSSLTDMSTSL